MDPASSRQQGSGPDRGQVAVIQMLIFLVGAMLGVIVGGAICVSYLRHEIAADIGPKLKTVLGQLDIIRSELDLALATRLADLSRRADK
jgi:hypothetical protein